MKKVTVTSRYKLYVRGEFVREVEYRFETDVAPEDAFLGLKERDEEEQCLDAENREAFEALVDAACE